MKGLCVYAAPRAEPCLLLTKVPRASLNTLDGEETRGFKWRSTSTLISLPVFGIAAIFQGERVRRYVVDVLAMMEISWRQVFRFDESSDLMGLHRGNDHGG